MSEENKAAFRRLLAETDRGNLDVIDELVGEDPIEHNPFPRQGPGREGVKLAFRTILTAFPDATRTIEDIVSEGDKVAVRSTLHGTHQGEFMGIPASGRTVSVPAIDIVRFEGGKMVEHWGLIDVPMLMMQLGAVPAPPAER